MILVRIGRLLRLSWHSLLFKFKSPASVKVEALNPCRITLGQAVRIGYFGRIIVNSPTQGSIDLADHVWSGRHVELQVWNNQQIKIGRKTTLQDGCKILGDVKIGAYSTLAPNVYISSGGHQFKAEPHQLIKQQDLAHPVLSKPVNIGEDVWLGINVAVKEGVTIGRGAIIGANSVVTKDVEPYAVYGGVPAKKLASRLEFSPPAKISAAEPHQHIYFYSGFNHEQKFPQGMQIINKSVVLALNADIPCRAIHLRLYSSAKAPLQMVIKIANLHLTNILQNGVNELTIAIEKDELKGANGFIGLNLESLKQGTVYVSNCSSQ